MKPPGSTKRREPSSRASDGSCSISADYQPLASSTTRPPSITDWPSALYPECAEAHHGLGLALLDQSRLDEAEAVLSRGIANRPDPGGFVGRAGPASVGAGRLRAILPVGTVGPGCSAQAGGRLLATGPEPQRPVARRRRADDRGVA